MHQNTTCHSGGAGYSWERLRVELFDVILFGVSALDPWTIACTSAGLFAIGVIATWSPVVQAARVSALTTLRDE